ncbi:MAG TPA: RusA family crossover junction endodeoxyribonuclease [Nitrospiraceae bacterium]|nr:RusA family crossover junction endodeoxyribonuclease [Nitrospiraceae bacterium]
MSVLPSGATITADRLVLTLPIPPSINHQYATVNGRRILSAMGRGYKAEVGRQVLVALARSSYRDMLLRTIRTRALALTIRFYFASPARRDVDGGVKITQDAVAEALGINDNRIVELHVYKSPGSMQPRLELSLSPSDLAPHDRKPI